MYNLDEGAADRVDKIIVNNESALCYFWQWSGMVLIKQDVIYSQKYIERGDQIEYYEDIEWSELGSSILQQAANIITTK